MSLYNLIITTILITTFGFAGYYFGGESKAWQYGACSLLGCYLSKERTLWLERHAS